MARRSKAIATKVIARRQQYFPELRDDELWHRREHDGFTSVPRSMPLLMSIIDDLTKGKPAGRVYFELWMRAYDEMYVKVQDREAHAFHSGYTGQRAVQSWAQRVLALEELGFIKVAKGTSSIGHIVIINPHIVVERLRRDKHPIPQNKLDALNEHAIEYKMKGVGVDPRDADKAVEGSEVGFDLDDEIPF